MWPDNMKVAPIREWPGALTPRRHMSNFSASWSSTLSLLQTELRAMSARNVELLVAIPPDQFRLDGKPRANAKQEHPGVILSFDSKVGHLSYAVDTFTDWRDNVRGIAKSLEALRMVDRYGTTKHGEQYRGFLAIEATAAPAGFSNVEEAVNFLVSVVGRPPMPRVEHVDVGDPSSLRQAGDDLRVARRALIRKAQRVSHPDAGGDAATFQRVSLAEAKLREEGLL